MIHEFITLCILGLSTKSYKKITNNGKTYINHSHPSFFSILLSGTLLLFLSLKIYNEFGNIQNCMYNKTYFDHFTLMILLLFFGLKIWSLITLGNYYTRYLSLIYNHQIISIGPYAYLIHPGFISQYMIYVTSLIIFKINPVIIISMASYMFTKMIKRILLEERIMKRHFSDEYTTFCKNKYRIIPFLY